MKLEGKPHHKTVVKRLFLQIYLWTLFLKSSVLTATVWIVTHHEISILALLNSLTPFTHIFLIPHALLQVVNEFH